MNDTRFENPHLFHIPVMGTGFSIDTPLKVARYGISSVIPLADDVLIEQMRKYHTEQCGLPFEAISAREDDARARRITAYLDFLSDQIRSQVEALQASPFEPGSEITKYFEMLPDSSLKRAYEKMLQPCDPAEKDRQQAALRPLAVPGQIDVNIMTKVDRDIYVRGEKLPPEAADASSGLRGFARSSLQSSIIFSAGLNVRLFGYLPKFEDFLPDASGWLRKKIVLKVSDFRSAQIQGKYLAKKGLWVSEYRIESGLNCGGHAFGSGGHLLGPILEEFLRGRTKMVSFLHDMYSKALGKRGLVPGTNPHEVRITVQGGIGTAEEGQLLYERYQVDGTGWGTPFLLVPEATNVDDVHLAKLMAATDKDVVLSDCSPLGLPFWNLMNSTGEDLRRQRMADDKPGSSCPKGFLVSTSEFTSVPICTASRVFQKKKLKQLDAGGEDSGRTTVLQESILTKSCLCVGLAANATSKLGIDPTAASTICCGPGITSFSKLASLEQMVSHIYGRLSLLTDSERPHMFLKEFKLSVDNLRLEIQKTSDGFMGRSAKYFHEFRQNLEAGAEHYREVAEQFSAEQKEHFLKELDRLFLEVENILPTPAVSVNPSA